MRTKNCGGGFKIVSYDTDAEMRADLDRRREELRKVGLKNQEHIDSLIAAGKLFVPCRITAQGEVEKFVLGKGIDAALDSLQRAVAEPGERGTIEVVEAGKYAFVVNESGTLIGCSRNKTFPGFVGNIVLMLTKDLK